MPEQIVVDTRHSAITETGPAKSGTVLDLLHQHIADPDTQWSLGTFGGVAEFSRGRNETVSLSQSSSGVSAVTARGAIAIVLCDGVRPFASESISNTGWSHRIALCLSAADCTMNRRTVLTELDSDRDALRPQDRSAVLFDLGLGALQADLCIRVDDLEVVAQLRGCAGRPVFENGNPAMSFVLAANPHRVFLSRIGRIEVYQPIPPVTGKSPEGPHTHVLPRLLNSGRSHPATEPIPAGWIPCTHLYPPHPARDEMGMPRSFDIARHDSFQRLMGAYGDRESLAIKGKVVQAIEAGAAPVELTQNREGRNAVRIALRQLKAAGHASATLRDWLSTFDPADAGEPGDGHQPAAHC